MFCGYDNEGVSVSNLVGLNFLPWNVFYKAVELLTDNGGKALKGDAMNGKLGDSKIPVDSIEGYIAYKVYGKAIGDSVFRRITPVKGRRVVGMYSVRTMNIVVFMVNAA